MRKASIVTALLLLFVSPLEAGDFWKDAEELYGEAKSIRSGIDAGMIKLDFKRRVVQMRISYDKFTENHEDNYPCITWDSEKLVGQYGVPLHEKAPDECNFGALIRSTIDGYQSASELTSSELTSSRALAKLFLDIAAGMTESIKPLIKKHK